MGIMSWHPGRCDVLEYMGGVQAVDTKKYATTVTIERKRLMIRVPWSEGSVDGSEILRSPVEGKVAEIPLFTRFYTSKTVVFLAGFRTNHATSTFHSHRRDDLHREGTASWTPKIVDAEASPSRKVDSHHAWEVQVVEVGCGFGRC